MSVDAHMAQLLRAERARDVDGVADAHRLTVRVRRPETRIEDRLTVTVATVPPQIYRTPSLPFLRSAWIVST